MQWYKIFSDEGEARERLRADIPQRVIVGETRIALVRHAEKFYAVQDACTHNGESLSNGKVNYLGEIICPWHGYRFQLLGGKACDSSCRDLNTYALKIDETGFFIGI